MIPDYSLCFDLRYIYYLYYLKCGFIGIKVPIFMDIDTKIVSDDDTQKQYYLTHSVGNPEKIFILRPECTVLSTRHAVSKNLYKIQYNSECYRSESRQKHRYNNFFQFGIEELISNSGELTIKNKMQINLNTLIHIILFDNFLSLLFHEYVGRINVKLDCSPSLMNMIKLFASFVLKNISVGEDCIRVGNSAGAYMDCVYEMSFFDDDAKKSVEILGGGEYAVDKACSSKIYGTGMAVGEERLSYLMDKLLKGDKLKTASQIISRLNNYKSLGTKCFLINSKRINNHDYVVEIVHKISQILSKDFVDNSLYNYIVSYNRYSAFSSNFVLDLF